MRGYVCSYPNSKFFLVFVLLIFKLCVKRKREGEREIEREREKERKRERERE